MWVKAPNHGFVGVGMVTGTRQSVTEFRLDDRNALDVLKNGHYHRQFIDDTNRQEYFVPIRWLDHVPIDQAVNEVGLFGNQNTVCRPRAAKWRTTVERLKTTFPKWDDTNGPV